MFTSGAGAGTNHGLWPPEVRLDFLVVSEPVAVTAVSYVTNNSRKASVKYLLATISWLVTPMNYKTVVTYS